jgi:putative intracellular protease/amidase
MNAGGPEVIKHYEEYLASIEDLKKPQVLEDLSKDRGDFYDAIFLAGGHGPMQDLAHSEMKHRSMIANG